MPGSRRSSRRAICFSMPCASRDASAQADSVWAEAASASASCAWATAQASWAWARAARSGEGAGDLAMVRAFSRTVQQAAGIREHLVPGADRLGIGGDAQLGAGATALQRLEDGTGRAGMIGQSGGVV